MRKVQEILTDMTAAGLNFKPQDIAANLFYLMTKNGVLASSLCYAGLRGRITRQSFTSAENIRLQGYLLSDLKALLRAAMKHNPDLVADLLDEAPKMIGYEESEVIESRIRAALESEEEVDIQALKKMVIGNIHIANNKGDYRAANDSTKLLFQYFALDDSSDVYKYIKINERNNSVCPYCKREVCVPDPSQVKQPK